MFSATTKLDPILLVSLVRRRPDLTLVPPACRGLSLDGAAGQKTSPKPQPQAPTPGKRRIRDAHAPSWWTARAKTGEVTPGFSKQEILRSPKEDPRAPGGVFACVGGLLA